MKHFTYIINIWILALTAISCTNEELTDNRLLNNKDSESTVTLNFTIPSMTDVNISRAAVAEPIEDLLVFVFDEKGDLMTSNPISFNKNELTDGSNGGMQTSHYPALGQYATTGWVRFSLKEPGNGKDIDKDTPAQIYLVGNAEYLTNNSIFTEETFTKIQSAKTFTALTKLICEYQTRVDRQEDHFLLAGAVLSYDGGTYYLNGDYSFPLSEWKNYTINLFRTDAKVDFEISSAEGCTFTPTSYQVCNAPKKTYLFWQYYIQQGGTVNDNSFKDVFNKDAGNNKEEFFDAAPIGIIDSNQFTFYIGENLKRCQTMNSSNLTEKQKLNFREKHIISENGEYVFTNAPELGTYVILKGIFEGSSKVDGKEVPVKAEVSYIIHLGFRNKANNTNPQWGDYNGDVNDYITKRNYHYTYHIKVKGVNDIVTEVTDGKENMSAAEGEVTIEKEEVITLTNNAPTATITLKKSESVTLAEEKTNTAWITVNGESFNNWISQQPAGGKYSFTAETPEEEVADRQVVLLATRTSTDGRSKIIRRITVKQTVS